MLPLPFRAQDPRDAPLLPIGRSLQVDCLSLIVRDSLDSIAIVT